MKVKVEKRKKAQNAYKKWQKASNSGRKWLSRVQKERKRRQPVLKRLASKEASKTQKHHSRLTRKHPFAHKALGLCITYTYNTPLAHYYSKTIGIWLNRGYAATTTLHHFCLSFKKKQQI